MKRYFDLMDDRESSERWHLGGPRSGDIEIDPRLFVRSGKPVQAPERMVVSLYRPGNPLDWTLADSGMPVASEKAASILRELAPEDVQLVPVGVEGTEEPYFIVNAWKVVACLDERRSIDVRKWGPDAHPLQLQQGGYEVVHKLIVDPSTIGPEKLFRVAGWRIALICDEEIHDAFIAAGVTGPYFDPVSPDD